MLNKFTGPTGAVAIALLVGSCCVCPPPAGERACIDFEDQAVGSQYTVGNSFVASGITIDVVAVGAYSNRAEITAGNYTTASGNDLRPLNVGVQFNLPPSARDVTMNYADLGGNNQFLINGASVANPAINQVIEFDGQTIGGVTVSVTTATPGDSTRGDVALNGTINSLVVVGQELWLDDVCYVR